MYYTSLELLYYVEQNLIELFNNIYYTIDTDEMYEMYEIYEIYDRANDPDELNNIIDKYPDTQRKLQGALCEMGM